MRLYVCIWFLYGSETSRDMKRKEVRSGNVVEGLCEDLIESILRRLSAFRLTRVSCVSRRFKMACDALWSRPTVYSALTFAPFTRYGLEKLFRNVVRLPMRPQFVVLWLPTPADFKLGPTLVLDQLSGVPIILCFSNSVTGTHISTNACKEMDNCCALTLGSLPGLQVEAIPLIKPSQIRETLIDQFLEDILKYTAANSKKYGIIMFGGLGIDFKSIFDRLGNVMASFTVASSSTDLLYRSKGSSGNKNIVVAVALLFERSAPTGMAETQLHVSLSTDDSPVDWMNRNDYIWLTGRREGCQEIVPARIMLDEIYAQLY